MNGQDDPTSIAIKAFDVSPRSISTGDAFNVSWSVDTLSGQYGQVGFHINDLPTLDKSDTIKPPQGLSLTAFTRVFQASTPTPTSTTVHDERSRACQRANLGAGQTDSVLCGSSGLNLLVSPGKPAYGILQACVQCSLSPGTNTWS